jgi:hypothetical protein
VHEWKIKSGKIDKNCTQAMAESMDVGGNEQINNGTVLTIPPQIGKESVNVSESPCYLLNNTESNLMTSSQMGT